VYNLADTLDELGLSRPAAEYFRAYLASDATSEWASRAQARLKAIL